MDIYRLTSPAFAHQINGLGGMYVSGRWHLQGHEILYTSPTVSLAILEMLAQPRIGKTLPLLHLQQLSIAEGFAVEEVIVDHLPDGWRHFNPYHSATQEYGVNFLLNSQAAALKVPSSVNPKEHNYIWSPSRARAAGLKLISHEPFLLDERLISLQ